jgi:peptide-methionine (R)-S-oxide reductase
MTTRRAVLLQGGVAASGVAIGLRFSQAEGAATGSFEVTHTPEEWRAMLDAEQYAVLRESGTERPYTSPLLDEHRNGTFACAGCDNPLFASATKYDSRTGGPSFWEPLENGVGTERDTSFGRVRTSVHCARCGGHLGHVCNDGPQPTGRRYCMNGVAMTFEPAA